MPYKLVKSGDGYIVTNSETGRKHSDKPLPRSRAVARMRALYAAENGTSTKAANYGAKVGEQIAGRLIRAAGGRFGSGDAAADPAKTQADAAATIAHNRALNAAAAKPTGRKRRAAKPHKPHKARAKKPHKGHVAKPKKARARSASGKRRDLARQVMHHARVAKALGLMEDAAGSLLDLAQGKKVTDDGGLAKMNLAVAQSDGTYKLTAAGDALAKAADAGDVKGARTIMDAITTKEAAPIIPTPMVFKDNNDRWRWVTFSSTAYRDRDGEIVSTKALADDVARADADGDYGPLRWWHMPGVDIGDCDFNAVTGRVLVESGTFRDERVGERIKAAATDLQVSIGFHHAPTEPVDGVFSSIRRFERSLLPAGRASNPYTRLLVQETPSMDQPKQDALKALLGDDKLLEQLLTQADQTTKAADAAGVAFKAAAPVPTEAPDDPADEAADAAAGITEEEDVVAIGDMAPVEFQELLTDALQPVADAIKLLAGICGGMVSTMTGVQTKEAAVETRLTEVETKAAAVPDLTTQLATTKAALEAAQAEIAELKGDLPKSVNERRASQSTATVLSPEQTAQYKGDDAQPRGDPNFINSFVLGQPVQQGA